jgi:glutamate carboxypeptidase
VTSVMGPADRIVERLKTIVEIETPNGEAEPNRALAEQLAKELERNGATVERFDAPGFGMHVRATVTGTQPELQPIVVLGHLDTVHPIGSLANMPFTVAEGRASGPGIYDMKCGVAILMESVLQLLRDGSAPRTVKLLLTCDEESGSYTSRSLIEETALGAVAALVPEPSLANGGVKTARKGVATYRLRITGRAAHAGIEPEHGISAVSELANQIPRIHALADKAKGTTLSVGVVRAGTAVNVIPAEAYAEIDVRYATPSEGRRIDLALLSLGSVLDGAQVEVERKDSRPPLERTDAVVALYKHARKIAKSLNVDLTEGSTGGGSDGCLTAAVGVPTLDGLGVRGGGAHAPHEHIMIEDIEFRVALMSRLLQTI